MNTTSRRGHQTATPKVPSPCGGNVARTTVQPKMVTVPAPCGGNVSPYATVQPKMANTLRMPAVPPPCGGNVASRASVQPKMPAHHAAPRATPPLPLAPVLQRKAPAVVQRASADPTPQDTNSKRDSALYNTGYGGPTPDGTTRTDVRAKKADAASLESDFKSWVESELKLACHSGLSQANAFKARDFIIAVGSNKAGNARMNYHIYHAED